MAVKLRLQRHGRKKRPFYHIVAADSRAPRDGRFLEKIGTYNPLNDAQHLTLHFDRALHWLKVGAQPTDKVRSLLSSQGVLLRWHLLRGVEKGAISMEEADKRFEAWVAEKERNMGHKLEAIQKTKEELHKKRMAIEAEINARREEALKAKLAEAEAALQAATQVDEVEEAAAKEAAPDANA